MLRTIIVLLVAVSVAACGKQHRRVELEGNSYFFPGDHISAITNPDESGSGQYYVRLKPPGGYYILVYAPSRERRRNEQGVGVPTVAHINDYPREVQVSDGKVGGLVCAKKPVNDESATFFREIYSCGFRVHDNGVSWSVIIPGDLAASASAIKRRAELTLADYRKDYWID